MVIKFPGPVPEFYNLPGNRSIRDTILDRDHLQHHEIDQLFDDLECLHLNGVDIELAMSDVFGLDYYPYVLDSELRKILNQPSEGDTDLG